MNGKRTVIWTAASLSLLAAAPALCAPEQDRQAIMEVERGIAAAKTVDQLMAYYEPGPDTVVYDSVAPGAVYGAPAIREDFAKQFAGVKSVKVDIRKISVGSSGPLGYAYSVQHAVMDNADGSRLEVTFRQTDILKKDDHGQWKIIHQQLSYPVDMASGKAAFNLPQ